MTPTPEIQRVGIALEHVDNGRWGVRANVAAFVLRAFTEDPQVTAVALPRRPLADAFNMDDRYTYRVLEDLVLQRVLACVRGRGRTPTRYAFNDPTQWRGVPWRFAGPRTDPAAIPEVLAFRLEGAISAPPAAKSPVVARYIAPQGAVAARWQRATKVAYGATPSRQDGAANGALYRATTPAGDLVDTMSLNSSNYLAREGAQRVETNDRLEALQAAIAAKANALLYGAPLDRLNEALAALPDDRLEPAVARALAAIAGAPPNYGAPRLATLAAYALIPPPTPAPAPRPYEPRGPSPAQLEAERGLWREELERAQAAGDARRADLARQGLEQVDQQAVSPATVGA